MKIITTSWDDGHPLDFKLAELLSKYNLSGTFYIPKTNEEHEVMDEKSIRQLSRHFEIGGHTLSHLRLRNLNNQQMKYEIQGCFHWLSDVTGYQPVSFCFPGGVYNSTIIKIALNAGFKVLRTTELLSLKPVNSYLVPTTFQIYQHNKFTLLKHLIKRRKVANLVLWLRGNAVSQLLKLTDYYLNEVHEKGGCLHVWGHSWEIEKYGLWQKLGLIFQHISNLPGFIYSNNQSLRTKNNE